MLSTCRIDWKALAILALHTLALLFFVFNRLVDGDEGFYLAAAQEVANGRIPYHDFFYPQITLLPYIMSIFTGHGFSTLYLARLASVVLAVLTSVMFYLLLRQTTTRKPVIHFLLSLYCFSGLVLTWHSVAKTYAVTDFCLMASFGLLLRFADNRRIIPLLTSGAFLAIAFNTRVVLAPLLLLFLAFILYQPGKGKPAKTSAFLLAAAIVSIPTIILFAMGPDRFLFNNLGFHLIRNPAMSYAFKVLQRLEVIGKLLINPQMLIVLAAFIGSLVIAWRKSSGTKRIKAALLSRTGLAGLTGLVISGVYLLPSPVHQQYFVQALPFLLLASPAALEWFYSRDARFFIWKSSGALASLLIVIYTLGVIPYVAIFVGGIRYMDSSNGIDNIKSLCDYLHQSEAAGPILAEWPAIPLLSGKPGFRGLEHIGFDGGLPMTDEQKRYYHIPVSNDLRDLLMAEQPRFIVVIDEPHPALQDLVYDRYELDRSFERYKVFRLR